MAGIVKTTTGLTGLAVARHPHQNVLTRKMQQKVDTRFNCVYQLLNNLQVICKPCAPLRILEEDSQRMCLDNHGAFLKSLRVVYEKILRTLQKIPVEAGYRKHTEKIVNHRLHLVKTEPDVIRLEEKMNSGQVEELLLQADRELALARRMIKWKAWEPLIATAPPKQWQWPVV